MCSEGTTDIYHVHTYYTLITSDHAHCHGQAPGTQTHQYAIWCLCACGNLDVKFATPATAAHVLQQRSRINTAKLLTNPLHTSVLKLQPHR